MSQGQPQQDVTDVLFNARQTTNLIYILAAGHATCFTVFMRHSFGTNALGRNGVVALLMILFYIAGTEDPRMLLFLWVWLAALVYQRLRTFRLWRKGHVWHSRYDGYPALGMKLPFTKTEGAAPINEILICFLAATAFAPWCESMAVFLMLGMVSLFIVRGFDMQILSNRVRSMKDAAIEQQFLAALHRGELDVNDF